MFSAFLHKFFTLNYLFGPVFPSIPLSDRIIYYFGIVLAVLGVILFFAMRSQKDFLRQKLLKRWANVVFVSGLAFVIWYGMRYELIDYLSTHIVPVLILLGNLVWLGFILKYQFSDYARSREQFDREQIKKKYL